MPEKTVKTAHALSGGPPSLPGASSRQPRSRERGQADRVYRLRSRVWFGAVANRYPDSVSRMDVDLLDLADTSGRVMWRIQRHASDPGRFRPHVDSKDSAVEIVQAKPSFKHTQAIYKSELFTEVLSPRPATAERRDALIAIVLGRLGLYEPTKSDLNIASANGMSIKDFVPPNERALRRWWMLFARKRQIDRVLLLCLLYQRALARTNLEEAILFRDATLVAIERFCMRPGFSASTKTLWQFMTLRRVFAGRVSLEHTEAALQAGAELLPLAIRDATTAAKLQQYEWLRYMAACALELQGDLISTHITARSAEIDDFVRRRPELEAKARSARYKEALARAQRDKDQSVAASARLLEMPGYREPWRPGDD